jgi:putative oxygen-independent coproporphyrinogen III oxidase
MSTERLRKQMAKLNNLGLYIHYPFCISKCAYCDFNSVAMKNIDNNSILNALIRDLQYYRDLTGQREIDTIYFGGGTPSLMEPSMIKTILEEVNKLFKVKDDAEITIEANPLTAEIEKFQAFKDAGINRISIGLQSFSDKGLKRLGRAHDVETAKEALIMAKKIFKRSSFDLIYGWEGQTIQDWESELQEALKYENGHLSLYQLTIYEGTALFSSGAKEIDDEKSLLFQNRAKEILKSKNIEQYEISNYARTGEESQHNLIYWHYDDYIGIGAGASGRITIKNEKIAFKNQSDINDWLKTCSQEEEKLSNQDQVEEYLLMGLRLNKGIDIDDFYNKTGLDISNILDDKDYLSDFLKIKNGHLFATEKGLNCLDSLVSKLL